MSAPIIPQVQQVAQPPDVTRVICKHCGAAIEYTRGRAYNGWVHSDGHLTCATKPHLIADPAPTGTVFTGSTLTELEQAADRVTERYRINDQFLTGQARWDAHQDWSKVYYETGELNIPVWELLCRIRQRLVDGAANDGVMSPGAPTAWNLLQPIQEEFVMAD